MKKIYLIIVVWLVPIILLQAQVTIGIDKAPGVGALLDLKNKDNGHSDKGLGMPRVILTDLTKLKMGDFEIKDSDNDGNQYDQHIGLLVYNAGIYDQCNPNSHPNGLYVWSGTKWEGLNVKREEIAPPSLDNDDPIYLPNSFIVTSTTPATLTFPITKAFRIWEYWGSEEGGNRLDISTIDLTGALSTDIVWMDNTIISNSNTDIKITGTGKDATMSVTTNGIYGNAVIALKIGNTIRWSWHIWVTPDPTVDSKSFNNKTWMDRNLGATSATPGDVSSKGNSYQWGRKDPFPTNSNFTNDLEPILAVGAVVKVNVTSNPEENLATAITQPLQFIKAPSGTPDWYSPNSPQWDNRWKSETVYDQCGTAYEGAPSPMDPCPAGWKVPASTSTIEDPTNPNVSAWDGFTKDNFVWDDTQKGRTHAEAGYYPITGGRVGASGNLVNSNSYGYLGTSSVANKDASLMIFTKFDLSPLVTWSRAGATSIRCIKK